MAGEDMSGRFDEHDRRAVADLDRDLAALLSVEPSPEFRARIRARVDTAPASRPWTLWWAIGTAAALVILAAGVVVLTRTGAAIQPQVLSQAPPALSQGGAAFQPDSAGVRRSGRELGGAARTQEAPSTAKRIDRRPPKVRDAVAASVIVDRAQSDTFRRLLAVARGAPGDAALELPPDVWTSEVPTIPVEPILIEPQQVPDSKSGENRER